MFDTATTSHWPNAYTGPERRSTAPSPMTRWLARMLDETQHGMLLITPYGRLRHANHAARDELARGQSLRLAGEEILATHRDQQGVLLQALAEGRHCRRRLITLGTGDQALPVAVVPMGDGDPRAEALVLLVLGRRQGHEALTLDFYARTQGLTSAEARVLQSLCDGLRPKEVAQRFDVAVSTVRTQISSIRAKTQTASIRDLVSKVGTLPPITPTMRPLASAH